MPTDHRALLKSIRTFPQLVRYLRDEMGWPIEVGDFEELDDIFFEFTPEELGIDPKNAAKIKKIRRLRPLVANQPWGTFFVEFESKKLPVVALRRILSTVALKKRASANSAERAAWSANDLLFVSQLGEEDTRQVSFAHFSHDESKNDLPVLKVLGWDNKDTLLHIDKVVETLVSCLSWPGDDTDNAQWRNKWRACFTMKHGEVVDTSRKLAERLAELARAIRDRIKSALEIENERGPLTKLMRAFQTALVQDMDADGFADMYAQTIAYGLLSARIVDPKKKTTDDLVVQLQTSPFLRELMGMFLNVGGRHGKAGGPGIDFDELGLSDVIELLDNANMEAVVRDFGDRTRGEDPVIHFYELFLTEYDKKIKFQRGVFYTPQPVVSYIVRSVHELLQTEFGLADGLADTTTWGEMMKSHPGLKLPSLTDEPGDKRTISPNEPFVLILDPATGTASFPVEVIEVIHNTLVAKWHKQGLTAVQQKANWDDYVPKHLLPRLYAYELMMAPYAIAHMKIGLKLAETGFRFSTTERVNVYLTNALEPWQRQLNLPEITALAQEAAAVNEVKRHKRFTVIVGNPPYSAASHNPSVDSSGKPTYIGALIRRYFEIDGEPLNERNPRWLQDDYVKFLCLVESLILRTSTGLIGVITNNGFLANPTFRGVRRSLMDTFTVVRLLDLHGNSKRGEKTPDGEVDENVFDIQQSVSISLLMRSPEHKTAEFECKHADVYGNRDFKYKKLLNLAESMRWTAVAPRKPFYLFVPRDANIENEFERGVGLPAIFSSQSVGIVTGRDALTVHFTRIEAVAAAKEFVSLSPEVARKSFDLGPDSRDWRVASAQKDLKGIVIDSKHCTPILYRPFDIRYTFYTGNSCGFHCMPRRENMRHLLAFKNLGLVSARSNKSQNADHFFCTRHVTEAKCGESTTQSCVFPLRLAPDEDSLFSDKDYRAMGLRQTFLNDLATSIHDNARNPVNQEVDVLADDVFGFIYAILYSPTYRTRYAEQLRIDFARVPLPKSTQIFRSLARLGEELVSYHVMEFATPNKRSCMYTGPERQEISGVGWENNTIWVDAGGKKPAITSGSAGFKGVTEDVWNFHIGGYQVCEKWLKDRKGRKLSKADIEHYQKIIVAIQETIRIMGEIDKVIEKHGGWPGAFSVSEAS